MDNLLDSLMERKIDEAFSIIQQNIERLKQENQMLRKENNELHDEAYKDNELIKMKKELDSFKREYYRGFPISKEEQKQIEEWKEKHEVEVHNCHTLDDRLRRSGTIGGSYTYEFIPTSIGTVGTIKCNCGAKFTFCELT